MAYVVSLFTLSGGTNPLTGVYDYVSVEGGGRGERLSQIALLRACINLSAHQILFCHRSVSYIKKSEADLT